jgi:hypothetical protein
MKIDQLRKIIAEHGNKIDTLSFTFDRESNLQDLIDFFKTNELEIRKIKLEFSLGVSLTERSTLAMQFNEILNHIKGLKAFELNDPVKDYVLRALLANTTLKFEELTLTHGIDENTMVNSTDFFEITLVSYLTQNPDLKVLVIEDVNEDITAAKYPQLKSALVIHPKLIEFNQGMVNIFPTKAILQKDPELSAAFKKKVIETPVAMKARLKKSFDSIKQDALQLNDNLHTWIVLRKKYHPHENTWHTAWIYLNQLLGDLKSLNKAYTQLNDGDETIPGQKALLNVFSNCSYPFAATRQTGMRVLSLLLFGNSPIQCHVDSNQRIEATILHRL